MTTETAASARAASLWLMAIVAFGCTVDTSRLRAPNPTDGPIAAEDADVVAEVVDVSYNSPDLLEIDSLSGEGTSRDTFIGSYTIDGADLDASAQNLDSPSADEEGPDVPSSGVDEGELDGAADTAIDADFGMVADGETVGTGGNGGGGGAGAGGAFGGAGGGAGSGGNGGMGGVSIDAPEESGVDLPDANVVFDGSDDVANSGGTGGNVGNGGAGGSGGSGGSGGNTGAGGTAGSGADPDLVLWYRFDESSGTIAADSSPSGAGGRDGMLGTAGTGGSATFSTDCKVGTHSLRLTPPRGAESGGYLSTPAPASLLSGEATIAFWIKVASAGSSQNWARIFDFGSGTETDAPYFYMTSRAADLTSAPPRFGISIAGHVDTAEQRLEGRTALVANVWQHIAIVLPAGATYTGTLYVDGAAVATNNAMTLHPSDVGSTTQNWIGRSPFASDPMFSGWLDDFRIYRRALSADEIASLTAVR